MLIENNILVLSLGDVEAASRGAFLSDDSELEIFCDVLRQKAEELVEGSPEHEQAPDYIPFLNLPFSKPFLERMMAAIQLERQARTEEERVIASRPRSWQRRQDQSEQDAFQARQDVRAFRFKLVMND